MSLHVEKYERIFLYLTVAVLVAAFAAIIMSVVESNIHLPEKSATIDPAELEATPPFDAPGLYQVGENEYQAVIVAQAFVFTPDEITVPEGATVTFLVASKDVIHGFMIPRTNVNVMVIPGQVTEITQTFKDAGEHQIICHEFCGIGHHQMYGKVVVEG
jgi:cytochrome c oxidase subunit 2